MPFLLTKIDEKLIPYGKHEFEYQHNRVDEDDLPLI